MKNQLAREARRPLFADYLKFWLRRAVNLAFASHKQTQQSAAEEQSPESMGTEKAEPGSLIEALTGMSLQGASVSSISAMLAKLGV